MKNKKIHIMILSIGIGFLQVLSAAQENQLANEPLKEMFWVTDTRTNIVRVVEGSQSYDGESYKVSPIFDLRYSMTSEQKELVDSWIDHVQDNRQAAFIYVNSMSEKQHVLLGHNKVSSFASNEIANDKIGAKPYAHTGISLLNKLHRHRKHSNDTDISFVRKLQSVRSQTPSIFSPLGQSEIPHELYNYMNMIISDQ